MIIGIPLRWVSITLGFHYIGCPLRDVCQPNNHLISMKFMTRKKSWKGLWLHDLTWFHCGFFVTPFTWFGVGAQISCTLVAMEPSTNSLVENLGALLCLIRIIPSQICEDLHNVVIATARKWMEKGGFQMKHDVSSLWLEELSTTKSSPMRNPIVV